MRFIILTAASLVLAACAAPPRNPVPLELQHDAVIPGIPGARYWADAAPANLDQVLTEMARQRDASGVGRDVSMLALSGGADNGAFGAGLLNAWTELGTRPEFTVVTGVSTGALAAPFAFLGPDYDDDLRQMYGGFEREQIFKIRGIFGILPNASVADTSPLADLIAHFVDDKMLDDIAREHRRGRRLVVQTANLDAERAMIWDLGAIADSRAPGRLDIFRDALLASASIPVAFPPVLFDVEAGGRRFDELHVDGSVVSVATVLSNWQVEMGSVAAARGLGGGRQVIYVVRNGRIAPEPRIVKRQLFSIAGRSIGTLLKVQGVADLLTAYVSADLRGAEFNATWMGEEFELQNPGLFDPGYMSALYDYGYKLMMSGRAWSDRPPVLMSDKDRAAAIRRPCVLEACESPGGPAGAPAE